VLQKPGVDGAIPSLGTTNVNANEPTRQTGYTIHIATQRGDV
jgi:hypothetical protein